MNFAIGIFNNLLFKFPSALALISDQYFLKELAIDFDYPELQESRILNFY